MNEAYVFHCSQSKQQKCLLNMLVSAVSSEFIIMKNKIVPDTNILLYNIKTSGGVVYVCPCCSLLFFVSPLFRVLARSSLSLSLSFSIVCTHCLVFYSSRHPLAAHMCACVLIFDPWFDRIIFWFSTSNKTNVTSIKSSWWTSCQSTIEIHSFI